ncbi:hypothetical protein NEOLEDRAFT_1060815 [Neolentinus lepideus HHB14362 ss-1]|uniref:Yeast cell wall synthesis Kre9/Knh1-like N-terminal domain-containing protein n=1 Tax=Neolentinus lepideus HHB14362 ss-1 TaxID=1314782 RepID=A0A165TZG3_9AGAM|nr:hypothetical protein NEOLEDRAFT_1060815 [Neolentinus lepideus HHB14362 ss-1]
MFTTPFMTFVFAILAALVAVVSAAPVSIRDVYVPPITYPTKGTVWKAGHSYNVTWNTSNPPKEITNSIGQIVLAKDGEEDWDHPLAGNFSILDGTHRITIPKTTKHGTDYSVVLFGDSGNYSPTFTIEA